MRTKLTRTIATLIACWSTTAQAVYLNIDNMDVSIGPGSTYTSENNTFSRGFGLEKVIDAPSATASEVHNQDTHLWFSGGALELLFDFRTEYDLTTLHFWNYNGEGFDVDNIDFTFFDSANEEQGSLSIMPALGATPNIFAEDILLAAPLDVQFVTAVLTGTNNQVDFQNIGFTGDLSIDRCLTNPDDPICTPDGGTDPDGGVDPDPDPGPTPVPEPGTLGLLFLGLAGLGLSRRHRS